MVGVLGTLERDRTEARKKGKNGKKSPRDYPVLPTAPTCPQACPGACTLCFVRPGAPTMCGNPGREGCTTPCSSDADCGAEPFCVSQIVSRASREVFAACSTKPGAFCTSIPACGG
jgi:hypothetical protein